jgi:hypothetical protein
MNLLAIGDVGLNKKITAQDRQSFTRLSSFVNRTGNGVRTITKCGMEFSLSRLPGDIADVCRVERLLTIPVANPDQDHTDELADVKQFRTPHPTAHPANAGQ